MDYNKKYYGVLSIGIYNAEQEDIFTPSDFFTKYEWDIMDEETQENEFTNKCYETMLSNYSDFGIREVL
ncbi:MAG: hypothetical protein R3321_11445 [Nitrososphaeraceae archaeon]|nr:hypothetical protein [Nitrososphaeraceae archaeon]